LYADYKQWATDGGDRSPLTSTAFGTKLTDRGVTKTHSERGAVYLGIGLRSDDEQPRG
jgi:phage/plasmid-associated DNA primase